MQPTDFVAGYPGRLVPTTGSGQAFVPDPLPPNLAPSWELANALSGADRALSALAGAARNLANPHLLIRPFERREAVVSSRIEGTQSKASDVLIFEAGQIALFPDEATRDDAQEVVNYVRALNYGVERMKTLPISLRFIRELHEKLMDGVRGGDKMPGEFRRDENWIGVPGASLPEARFVPPPPHELPSAMNALETYLHDRPELPALARMALIHYQFETIHPFVDGNGRIGRLLIPLLLIQEGLLPQPLLYLSAYFERTREQYYSLLLRVSQKGAWSDWILYFLRGIAEQSSDAMRRSLRLLDLQRTYHDKIREDHNSGRLLILIDSLFESPLLTTAMAAERTGVTYAAARSHIRTLVSKGVLKQYGAGTYRRLYVAPDILHLIDADRVD